MQLLLSAKCLLTAIENKKVLFITTKNLSYIRNTQEISLIKKYASQCDIIGSNHSSYFIRLSKVYYQILTASIRAYDTVWIGFAPQLVLPLFRRKLCKSNLQVVEDFFISMYDTLCYDRKKIKKNSRLAHLLYKADKLTLSLADIVICDTHAHGQYFAETFLVNPEKIYTLYLQADTSIFHPMSCPRPDFLKNKFVILYFGSILPLQGADIVLEAMNILKKRTDFYFYFIGPMKDKKIAASKPVSKNIKYFDWLSLEELAMYIHYSDLCLAGHFNSSIEKAKRTIPGKAYIYQAMDKPMILGENPANHELFSNASTVSFVEMGNAQALADAIVQFHQQRLPSNSGA